ncbi:glycosyl hydrolase family 28-related protein [Neobacillus drentensis]|uniref:glycosyl hydrolase family 28-related protein n=1 Tax=Neobacillus drentensis TaxID=220684 RepID=UPI0030009DD7
MKKVTLLILFSLTLLSFYIVTKQVNNPSGSSVKNYGAKGNGLTDDTKSFQKTIDSVAKNGGGDVNIPAGTYILQPIFVKSNVNLVGENRDTVTLKLSNTANDQKQTRLVNVNEVKNVQIRNLTIDGNYENHTDGIEHMHTIFIWDSNNIVIDNKRLQNAVGDGISVSGSTKASNHVTISNNIILNNHRSNIVVEQVNHIKIFNNMSKASVGRPALHFEPFEEINLYDAKSYNNTFETNASDISTIQIEGTKGAGNYYHDIELYDNKVKGRNGKFMIKETKDAKIHVNTFLVQEMHVWFKSAGLGISNNTIDTQNGMIIEGHLGASVGTSISKNNVITTGNGTSIKTSAKNTVFTGNTITGTGKGKAVYLWAKGPDIKNT